jgi:hypothetical protein
MQEQQQQPPTVRLANMGVDGPAYRCACFFLGTAACADGRRAGRSRPCRRRSR